MTPEDSERPSTKTALPATSVREALKRSISGFSSGSFSGEYGKVIRSAPAGALAGASPLSRLLVPPPFSSSLAAAARERDQADRERGEQEDGELAALHDGHIIA